MAWRETPQQNPQELCRDQKTAEPGTIIPTTQKTNDNGRWQAYCWQKQKNIFILPFGSG